MVNERVLRPNQIRLYKSQFRQNMTDSEEYSKAFLLCRRKDPEERMTRIFENKQKRKRNPQGKTSTSWT